MYTVLQQAYENIKKKSKKAAATDRAEQFKTGGGMYVPVMDCWDEKMLSLLGNRATPLPNPYDSAAYYYSESELSYLFQFWCWCVSFS